MSTRAPMPPAAKKWPANFGKTVPDSRCCPACWSRGQAVPLVEPCPICERRERLRVFFDKNVKPTMAPKPGTSSI